MSNNTITDKELIQKLQNVINALNHVSCEGMQNLLNLGGSIGVINEIIQNLLLKTADENKKK